MARKSVAAAAAEAGTQAPAEDGPGPGPSGGALELVWVHPTALTGHPDNVRTHPPEQLVSIRESLASYGWVEPFIINRRNGLLVDGHARLQIALDDEMESVPALYGDWSEEQHADLLGILDAIGAQARVDLQKFAALQSRMTLSPDSALGRLRSAIAHDPFFQRGAGGAVVLTGQAPKSPGALPLMPGSATEVGVEPGPGLDPPPLEPAMVPLPVSQVRMVQLFLNLETFPEFSELVELLKPKLGTDNPTDTVLEALRHLVSEL